MIDIHWLYIDKALIGQAIRTDHVDQQLGPGEEGTVVFTHPSDQTVIATWSRKPNTIDFRLESINEPVV